MPWLQVAEEVFERAQALADMLGLDGDDVALGRLLKFWRAALTWGDPNKPPEGLVVGPHAAQRITSAFRWKGPPEQLIAALVEVGFLGRIRRGYRVRGLSRYRSCFLRNHNLNADGSKRNTNHRAVTERKQRGDRAETEAPEVEVEVEVEKKPISAAAETTGVDCQDKPEEKPVAVNLDPLSAPAPTPQTDEPGTTHLDCWRYMGTVRAQMGRPGELRQPKGYERWHALATAQVGITALDRAYIRYLEDDAFAAKGWPTAIFMSDEVWSSRTFEEPPRRWRQ